MASANRSVDAPCSRVVADVKNFSTVVRYGAGELSYFIGAGTDQPLMLGIWNADDMQDNTTVVEIENNEVKYIISGEATLKDVDSGEEFHVSAGSVIWLPKGARTLRVRSRGLVAFYVGQADRPITTVSEPSSSWVGTLDQIHARVVRDFVTGNPKSQNRFEEAAKHMPGGNTRSVLHYDPFPLAMFSARDCYVTSVDGVEYLDFVSEFSAAFFGHSNPYILEAIQQAMSRGINRGGPGDDEVELARLIKDRFQSIDTLRFCNSGTEANTVALALATRVTKRSKILAFENGYHGGFIGFGAKQHATTIPHDFVLGRFNDIEYTKSMLSDEIAAIIVEPMQGTGGVTPGTPAFLQFLRDEATRLGAVLIFDEVVTSRLHINGLQGHLGIFPDITTLGKYIGGGPSFGAFGGRGSHMGALDPRQGSALTHSGTYNNNAFTMAAGIAGAKFLTQQKILKANSLSDKLREGVNSLVKKHRVQLIHATGFGSIVGLHFSGPGQPGFYIGKRGFVSLNLVHEEKHIDCFLEAFQDFMDEVFKGSTWT
ncbi:putative glutamate-1-semialdehyde 2,1-aminomutase [Ilyonectria sp. MPI-CAGE-AT-0026]|nr:putative glutamate-1-semialdehyde 2,1-aminomutase [Ilyonectria sp. MPI-CAGE-AT-0026]